MLSIKLELEFRSRWQQWHWHWHDSVQNYKQKWQINCITVMDRCIKSCVIQYAFIHRPTYYLKATQKSIQSRATTKRSDTCFIWFSPEIVYSKSIKKFVWQLDKIVDKTKHSDQKSIILVLFFCFYLGGKLLSGSM